MMTLGQALSYRSQLKRIGIDSAQRMVSPGEYVLVAQDHVACSSGSRKWVETRPMILRTEQDAIRYMQAIN